MIRLSVDGKEKRITASAEVSNRYAVYLDNDSLIELAKHNEARRKRFIDALLHGGTLLFSWASALEIAGPQGGSARKLRAFLDEIGSCWVPLQSNPWQVVQSEEAGADYGTAVVSTTFMEAYCKQHTSHLSPEDRLEWVDKNRESFFRLSSVFDWVHEHRDKIRSFAAELDPLAQSLWKDLSSKCDKQPQALDYLLPPLPYNPKKPARFVLTQLQRTLILEARAFQFKKHDGVDFCHAVVAAAYANIATLDKQWKRRVECLPKPNELAKIYYRPEVDKFVDVLEELIASRPVEPGRIDEPHKRDNF